MTRLKRALPLVILGINLSFHICIARERPNIVIIYTDDQGYGDVSALNPDAKFSTPNIDRIATEGIIFSDGHSSDGVCSPSMTNTGIWMVEEQARGEFQLKIFNDVPLRN